MGNTAQHFPTILAYGVSFPARILYSMSATETKLNNIEDAVNRLFSAAHDYDDPQAHRMLATLTSQAAGDEKEFEQHLLKAAVVGDAIAPIHLATYYWSNKSEKVKPRDRAMARRWFDIFALEEPNQFSVKVIQAADRHASNAQVAKDGGLASLKAIERELSVFERREKTIKRAREQVRALADFISTWKSITAELISHWGSPGFCTANFEWPKDIAQYLPLESLQDYDLNQDNVRLRNVTRARRKDSG